MSGPTKEEFEKEFGRIFAEEHTRDLERGWIGVAQEGPRSQPERHNCCHAARAYLRPRIEDGTWCWFFMSRYTISVRCRLHQQVNVRITYCPWCGERLPERGRLRMTEIDAVELPEQAFKEWLSSVEHVDGKPPSEAFLGTPLSTPCQCGSKVRLANVEHDVFGRERWDFQCEDCQREWTFRGPQFKSFMEG